MHKIEDVLDFWFTPDSLPQPDGSGGEGRDVWFNADPAFDREIIDRFSGVYDAAASGRLADWTRTAQGTVALVIVLDQFPRNMFRESPRAFETDPMALDVAEAAIARGLDRDIPKLMRLFLYMPFQHAEDIAVQQRSMRLHEGLDDEWLLGFARWHHDVIKRFGRFPHRNAVLGRQTTLEEREFLESGDSLF
ncbi:MAG: DUF924 family protein [Alphaproteobacteria bacterium]